MAMHTFSVPICKTEQSDKMSMHTFNTSKYITKSGSSSDLQKVLNDLSEQDYELVNLFMFMSSADGLRFHLVMKR